MGMDEECDAESLGRGGRYGCRCRKCCEGEYTEAESKGEDR